MVIGINGQRILIKEPAGPEVYTINMIRALAKVDKSNRYIIYVKEEPSKEFWKELTGNNRNFSYRVIGPSVSFLAPFLSPVISWTQMSLAYELLQNPIDVFFTPVHTMPIIHRADMRIVGMIHGLEYKFSEYKSFLKKMTMGRTEWYVARFSDLLIVPTTHTKKEILSQSWGIPESKFTVVPEGVSGAFGPASQDKIRKVQKKYGLSDKEYLLFISTIQPRKNIPGLVAGFSEAVQKTGDKQTMLVLVGKKGWLYEESYSAAEKYGVADRVKFLGRVPDEDLPVLLSGAKSFVSTSFDEGFGLPLLEAMRTGVPALVSDITAFKELGKNAVWYADPKSTEDIGSKIAGIINGKYDADLVKQAREISMEYTWERSAERTLSVFRQANEL